MMQMWLKQETRPNFNCCGPGCDVTEQIASWEPYSSSSTREIPCILWHLKLHKRVYNNPQSSELRVTCSNILRLIPDKPPSRSTLLCRRPLLLMQYTHSCPPKFEAASSYHILRTSGVVVTTVNIQHYGGRLKFHITAYKVQIQSYVYWTVHLCNSWRIKDQLDVTCYCISLLMRSTCFGH